jgi:hypothetical protein
MIICRIGSDFFYIFSAESNFLPNVPLNFEWKTFKKKNFFSAENSHFYLLSRGKKYTWYVPRNFPRKKMCGKIGSGLRCASLDGFAAIFRRWLALSSTERGSRHESLILVGFLSAETKISCHKKASWPGLPDGTFSNRKIPIWVNFGRSCNGRCVIYLLISWYVYWSVGMFIDQLVYFVAIWYIVWPFGKLYGYLVYFSRFGMLYQTKIWQPRSRHSRRWKKAGWPE